MFLHQNLIKAHLSQLHSGPTLSEGGKTLYSISKIFHICHTVLTVSALWPSFQGGLPGEDG